MTLDEHMQRQVNYGIPALDIMHGYLKVLLVEAEKELEAAQEEEDRTEEAMDSMERKYCEGQVDVISHLYSLTYALSFAIQERDKNGQG